MTRRMIFSFLIDYPHAKERYQKVCQHGGVFFDKQKNLLAQEKLGAWIGENIPSVGIVPQICADDRDWSRFNIKKASCIDRGLINMLTGNDKKSRKDPAQRVNCGCTVSRDIGANDSCLMRCFYCYATKDFEKAGKNNQRHDPMGEYLINNENG